MTFRLVVHSFKGGPGKSTITANLAVALGLSGKRVGVMDMDLAGPGLHVIFEIKSREMKHTLHDVLLKRSSARDVAIDLTERFKIEKGMLVFIPASRKAEDIVRVLQKGYELEMIRKVMEEISLTYSLDYLLIDTRPGIDESTLLGMSLGNSILLITRIDNQDIFGTGVTLEVARALKKPVFLLLNMIPPHMNMKKTREKLASAFRVPIINEIPFYPDVLKSLSSGVFILKHPDHDFSAKIRATAAALPGLRKEQKKLLIPP